MNTNHCNQTMIERGMAEGWSAGAVINAPSSIADASRAKYSELVGVSRALLATTAPAARSGGPRWPRDLPIGLNRSRGAKWVVARVAGFAHPCSPLEHPED
jgi:hypothetical protein